MRASILGSVLLSAAVAPVLAKDSASAAVYELSNSANAGAINAPSSAGRLYLADKLGLADFFYVEDNEVEALNKLYENDVAESSSKPKLLVELKGVDHPGEFFQSQELPPHFNVKDHVKNLVGGSLHKFASILSTAEDNIAAHLTKEIKAVGPKDVVSKLKEPFRHHDDALVSAWKHFTGKGDRHKRDQQRLDLGLQDSGLKLVNDKHFINDLASLIQLKTVEAGEKAVVFAQSVSLLSIGRKIGYDSKTYQLSKKALGDVLIELQNKFDVIVVAVGLDEVLHETQQADLEKRGAELESLFSTFEKRESGAACFSDEAACNSATSNCSSHGACKEIKKKCWQCACKASYDKKKSKTTNWSGFDCGKKDISATAHLLLWTSVALILSVAAGVKLLFSMGDDALPGVLEAATQAKKTGQ
ncbi:uncharacterized protein CXQ87_003849 [Candidozyma duobushaemuli]|nr:uncharacterized protein CXQ87_003849 [[Candida] duobushaemulonis]PVH15987.1 hypothetical protein CXQ87_003849 [[Candida] duobushaemulonis]